MRLSAFLMLLGLIGVLVGAMVIGRVAFGLAVVADSASLVAYGLLRDVPQDRSELVRRRAARRQAA